MSEIGLADCERCGARPAFFVALAGDVKAGMCVACLRAWREHCEGLDTYHDYMKAEALLRATEAAGPNRPEIEDRVDEVAVARQAMAAVALRWLEDRPKGTPPDWLSDPEQISETGRYVKGLETDAERLRDALVAISGICDDIEVDSPLDEIRGVVAAALGVGQA